MAVHEHRQGSPALGDLARPAKAAAFRRQAAARSVPDLLVEIDRLNDALRERASPVTFADASWPVPSR
jgi:hypothetical protein